MTEASQPVRRLRRAQATIYLREVWGIDRAISTLAKEAVTGGGPKFEYCNTLPLYTPENLDAYALKLLSPLKSSTSDGALPGKRARGRKKGNRTVGQAPGRPEIAYDTRRQHNSVKKSADV